MDYLPVLDESHYSQAGRQPCPASSDSSQKPDLDHWPEPCTLSEKKERDLEGLLFDDSCLFVS